jgi:hypothetical protein
MKISIITETTGDLELEYTEPEGYFSYEGNEYPYWGNPDGRAKTIEYDVGKFNRYAKISALSDEFTQKFKDMVKNDWESPNGRCSFACLVMMKYGVRIGNEDSAAGYESGMEETEGEIVQTYGTTTLLNKHVVVGENSINLDFLGKTQVEQNISIDDPFVVEYAKRYDDPALPENKWLGIDYDMLFKFVKNEVGDSFVPKDFRTFCANVTGWTTIKSLLDKPKRDTKTEVNDETKIVVESVADKLGNTPGISKRSYIDARMLDWFKGKRLKEDD